MANIVLPNVRHICSAEYSAETAFGRTLLQEMCASWSWREVENVSETEYRKEVYSGLSERVGKRSPEAAIGEVIKSYLGHLTQALGVLVPT